MGKRSAGAIKKLMVDALRKGHQKRRPRSRGKDRRGGIRNMRSIRERPEEAQSREVPGHWEGDLIKGAFNGSAIGTLVDRSTRFVILARWTIPPQKRCWKASPDACARFPRH
jgi:IS30 family transposase